MQWPDLRYFGEFDMGFSCSVTLVDLLRRKKSIDPTQDGLWCKLHLRKRVANSYFVGISPFSACVVVSVCAPHSESLNHSNWRIRRTKIKHFVAFLLFLFRRMLFFFWCVFVAVYRIPRVETLDLAYSQLLLRRIEYFSLWFLLRRSVNRFVRLFFLFTFWFETL